MLLNFITVLLLFTLTEQSELKIISPPDGTTRPEPCALTCVGATTGSGWMDSSNSNHPGRAFIRIDYSACGFVSIPVVTAIGQDPAEVMFTNPYTVINVNVYTKTGISAEYANTNQWTVHWIATGYNCE